MNISRIDLLDNAIVSDRDEEAGSLPMLDSAIACAFHSIKEASQEAGYCSGWITRPHAVIAHVLDGHSTFRRRGVDTVYREPGDTVYVPADTSRSCHVTSRNGSSILWVQCSFTLFGGIDVMDFVDIPPKFTADTGGEFCCILRGLMQLDRAGTTSMLLTAIERQKYLSQLLSLLVRHSRPKSDTTHTLSSIHRLASAVRYITENYRARIEIEDLADMVCLSKSQFHRCFKKTFKLSPMEYQKRLRLRHAQHLLQSTDLSSAEIATRVGYSDYPHFSRMFKDHVGASPSEYRKQTAVNAIGF